MLKHWIVSLSIAFRIYLLQFCENCSDFVIKEDTMTIKVADNKMILVIQRPYLTRFFSFTIESV